MPRNRRAGAVCRSRLESATARASRFSRDSTKATRSFFPGRVERVREAITQVFQNLRANKLRSFLTMFGILWGVISVVVLSATGEGFQRGNQKVLEELGRNIAIVWGGRTSMQAGGERAGRRVFLTLDDARALARESSLIAVVSPELQRGG